MHETEHPLVRGHLDSNNRGWCFHITGGILDLRIVNNNKIALLNKELRPDVAQFYKNDKIINCGWNTEENEGQIEMLIDGQWVKLFNLITSPEININIPSFIVVDNFYKNPDKVREFALKQNFKEDIRYYKGARTSAFRFDDLCKRFEQILNTKIINWSKYSTNCCFQVCKEGDLTVYHCDNQQYAGVLYLTPDAPVKAGTQILRSVETKKMVVSKEEAGLVFKNGHYDASNFEVVDNVGNLYNRLILFNSKQIHAAPLYFGNSLETGRLFQLFFFDLENNT